MLTDRGACTALDEPDIAWLDGLSVLHVPLYSLVGDPLAATTRTLIGWARESGVAVSIDAASSAVIVERGVADTLAELQAIAPDVLLCNELEAETLGGFDAVISVGARTTVIKQGSAPALVIDRNGGVVEVDAHAMPGDVDTTGAGDAFAAGFLVAWSEGADAAAAAAAGHTSARDAIAVASAAPEQRAP